MGQNVAMSPSISLFLADAILLAHWAFAGFIVLGLTLVLAGGAAGWRFVRNRRFRLAHLAAMGIVVGESLLGAFCPLTEWEARLRQGAGQAAPYRTTFMDHWAQKLFYWELSETTFAALYIGFFVLMLASWRLVPPASGKSNHTK